MSSKLMPVSILGGLPAFASITGGKDADTPNGPGEYWCEVAELRWAKRNGTPGGHVTPKVWDRAIGYDEAGIIEQVCEQLAYEASLERQAGNRADISFDLTDGVANAPSQR